MASHIVARSLGRAAARVPGIRRLPVLKLVSIAEVGMMAREHIMRLTPDERRRLVQLVRVARGRPSSLSQSEREHLADLVAKLEPRLLAGEAAARLSPVPLPRRMVRGKRKSR